MLVPPTRSTSTPHSAEGPEDPDMGEAAGPAATQHQPQAAAGDPAHEAVKVCRPAQPDVMVAGSRVAVQPGRRARGPGDVIRLEQHQLGSGGIAVDAPAARPIRWAPGQTRPGPPAAPGRPCAGSVRSMESRHRLPRRSRSNGFAPAAAARQPAWAPRGLHASTWAMPGVPRSSSRRALLRCRVVPLADRADASRSAKAASGTPPRGTPTGNTAKPTASEAWKASGVAARRCTRRKAMRARRVITSGYWSFRFSKRDRVITPTALSRRA